MIEMTKELRIKLNGVKSLEEVKDVLATAGNEEVCPEDAERIWEEIEHHRNDDTELDPEELEAVSGGYDRDWVTEGCAATCEEGSHCWSNDRCIYYAVVYKDFHDACPNGDRHNYVFDTTTGWTCTKCGKTKSGGKGFNYIR